MDDQKFDQRSSQAWINLIESEKSTVREKDIYPILRSWVEQVNPETVLEIGCGQGACSQALKSINCKYTGVEPSVFLLERARQLYSDASREFILGNAYKLPLESIFFDSAFSVAVWHLLGDLGRAARELSRVLKENGKFMIITASPRAYSLWTSPYVEIKQEGKRVEGGQKSGDTDVLFLHTSEEIVGSLRETQLEVQSSEEFRDCNGLKMYICFKGQKRAISQSPPEPCA